ncbi:MAG: DNA repair protein RecN [Nitriliruptorales bacterium]|nr:DNA repair protein RecN [Nitriliruptorales bacterium]
MIDELHIRSLGVIEDASLALSPGLTVVTGETGAGKTMLVSALGLLLGDRADTSLVREGADTALVEATISPPPAAAAEWCQPDDEQLIVSREVTEGRSRARLQGRLVPVSALAEALGGSVEVHAQHSHVRLSQPRHQRALLDRYAGEPHAKTLAAFQETYTAWQQASADLEQLEDRGRERARRADRLRFEVEEIEAAGLDPEADGRLESELELLEHAEDIERAVREAVAALGDGGAADPLGVAVSALRRIQLEDTGFNDLAQRLESLAAETTELRRDLRAYADGIDADPGRLEQLRDRQAAIRRLSRKYGGDVETILAYAADARRELEELEAAEAGAAGLAERVDALGQEVEQRAQSLARGRRAAGDALADAVQAHLADLGMPHARFAVELTPVELGPHGADRVTFQLAPNPGEPARPVHEAASGGERSRVALSIEVALADVDDVAVLVFDEVDAGVGGRTAMAVGDKLARLAASGPDGSGRQVLCVTHLPQLAAFADVHHVVEKGIAEGRTVTSVRRVEGEERVEEIARMMGGRADGAGREHARELLGEADHLRAG